MVRRDGAETRRQRMQELSQLVMRTLNQLPPNTALDLSEMLPELEYETGLTKAKITEYLSIISATGRFELDLEHGKIAKFPTQATPEQILDAARGSTSG